MCFPVFPYYRVRLFVDLCLCHYVPVTVCPRVPVCKWTSLPVLTCTSGVRLFADMYVCGCADLYALVHLYPCLGDGQCVCIYRDLHLHLYLRLCVCVCVRACISWRIQVSSEGSDATGDCQPEALQRARLRSVVAWSRDLGSTGGLSSKRATPMTNAPSFFPESVSRG